MSYASRCFMSMNPRTRLAHVALVIAGLPLVIQAQSYPMTWVATAEMAMAKSAVTATFTIHLEGLMPDLTFKIVADALKYGGYPNFLPALRKLPAIGYVELGNTRTEIKYARMRAGSGSHLVIGTDQPIFFVGGGAADPKRKAGYEVGIIELDLDAQGNGSGTMAAAARVKPAPDGSVVIDDYADAPIKVSVKPAK
jgi:hypothetical protein